MNCLLSLVQDPFFHLAAEEFLLKNRGDDYFLLWQSTPAVIVGKHQNTLAEINYRYIIENKIDVTRRLTGGGTVFHGPGNLNFSFIRKGEAGRLVDFAGFIAPVIGFIRTLGLEAIPGPKHEILAGGRKISGNAEHVYKNRVLHHGTMLFDANLDMLQASIQVKVGKYTDRAVQSNRGIVANIKDMLDKPLQYDEFRQGLFDFIMKYFNGRALMFSEEDIKAIRKIENTKFRNWEWIYGWSPDYELHHEVRLSKLRMCINLMVHRGLIQTCRLTSAEIPESDLMNTSGMLQGVRHREAEIRMIITCCGLEKYMSGKDLEEMVIGFF
jgi:lipoate-protein ligase A